MIKQILIRQDYLQNTYTITPLNIPEINIYPCLLQKRSIALHYTHGNF